MWKGFYSSSYHLSYKNDVNILKHFPKVQAIRVLKNIAMRLQTLSKEQEFSRSNESSKENVLVRMTLRSAKRKYIGSNIMKNRKVVVKVFRKAFLD